LRHGIARESVTMSVVLNAGIWGIVFVVIVVRILAMSDDTVSVTQGRVDYVEDLVVNVPKIRGFIAFSRTSEQVPWTIVWPETVIGVMAPAGCPSPLFQSRAAVVDRVKQLSYCGSEVKIFEVRE